MPGETTDNAAIRRLYEELGFITPIKKAFHFTYQAPFDNGLTEYEFDHVYVGEYDGAIQTDADEVDCCRFVDLDEIEKEILSTPASYTPWFLIAFPLLKEWMRQNKFHHA
jgi:isopentenyl-diphosphate delta-isomerase